MKHMRNIFALLVIGSIAWSAFAGLPEPAALLYGAVFRSGNPLRASDNVVVRARVNRAPLDVFPGPEDWIVGIQRLGEGPGAAVQKCSGSDCYVMSVRLEAVPGGLERTPGCALIGEEVRLCTAKGQEPEVCADRDRVRILERGFAARRNLGLDAAKFDWNRDGHVDNVDQDALADCLQGPAFESSARCQEVFDAANFGTVDLASFARLQLLFDRR